MKTLEEKLGYTFRDPALLENALTHSSCANESRGKLQSNERLEFWEIPSWAWWWQSTCSATTLNCLKAN